MSSLEILGKINIFVCVKHDERLHVSRAMDGVTRQDYRRKNYYRVQVFYADKMRVEKSAFASLG